MTVSIAENRDCMDAMKESPDGYFDLACIDPPYGSDGIERTGHGWADKFGKSDHIISWSNPGDIVLDPFMGSGTTAKCAMALQRKYIGFEISKEYVEMANRRLNGVQQYGFGLI